MKKQIIRYVAIATLITQLSCSKENMYLSEKICIEEKVNIEVPDMSNIDASSRDLKLFANINTYLSGNSSTKASGCIQQDLESMLDRNKTKSLVLGVKTLFEIPFKDEYSNQDANLTLIRPDSFNSDSLSIIKTSLLDWYENKTNKHTLFVLTMIPYPDSYCINQGDEYSFLSAIYSFRGILLISEPDGTYISSYEYIEGESLELEVINPSEKKNDHNKKDTAFISFRKNSSNNLTKSNEVSQVELVDECDIYLSLTAAVCIAEVGYSGNGGSSITYTTSRKSEVDDLLYGAWNYTYTDRSYGGGGSSNSNTQINSKNSAKAHGIIIKGDDLNKIEAIQQKINSLSNLPTVKKLLNQLNTSIIKINISEINKIGFQAETIASKIINTNTLVGLNINISENTTDGAILEELFHCLQYQQSIEWLAGDREFEAKIFLALMYIESNGKLKIENDFSLYVNDLCEFYYHPSNETFLGIENYLGKHGYYQTMFPKSNISLEKRIKHIKNLKEK